MGIKLKKVNSTVIKIFTVIASITLPLIVLEAFLCHQYRSNNFAQRDRENVVSSSHIEFRKETADILDSLKQSKSKNVVLFIGDSFTYGAPGDYSDSFPAVIQSRLRHDYPSLLAVNAGVSAANMVDYYLVLKQLLSVVKPRIVVLNMVSNDIQFASWNHNPAMVCPNFNTVVDNLTFALERSSYIFHYLHHNLYLKYISDRLTRTADCSSIYLKKIRDLVSSHRAELLITYHHDSYKHERACSSYHKFRGDIISDFISLYQVSPIMLTDRMMGQGCSKAQSYYAADSYHLTAEGYHSFADILTPYIRKEISK